LASGLLIASLVSYVAAGDVNTSRRAALGSATPIDYYRLYCLIAVRLDIERNRSPVDLSAGTIWGLWIAGFAKHSPDLWGQSRRVTAFSACRGVDFLLLRGACSGNAATATPGMARCGPSLGKLSGGN
jgi:hypothetical protein